jgi:hypothetical protein
MSFNPINGIKKLFGLGQYPMVYVKSTIDNKEYLVRELPDKQEAADLMAKIRLKLSNLKIHLEQKYPDKPQVKQLASNFEPNPSRFYESTPDADLTSYSVNKGESVHLCLRHRASKDDNSESATKESLVDENIIMFVSIHEMGHMITKSVGHGPDFWNNFAWILKEAESIGIYKAQDFRAHPVKYCGMSITDQPSYDPKIEGFKNRAYPSKDGTDLSIGSVG